MIERIEIFRGETLWLARIGGEPAIWELFGTDVLATAFTPQAPAHQIKAALQKLHPHARIVFLEEIPPPL